MGLQLLLFGMGTMDCAGLKLVGDSMGASKVTGMLSWDIRGQTNADSDPVIIRACGRDDGSDW